jgi:uncharacterized repeat protein (TIGR03803 family)
MMVNALVRAPDSVLQSMRSSKAVHLEKWRHHSVSNPQQRIQSKIRQRAASSTLMLAVMFLLGGVTIPSAQAQTFTDLFNFTGKTTGAFPQAGLVRDAAGNLYGATRRGGVLNFGVIFKVDTSGAETVLFNFSGGTDGKFPHGNLILDTKGNLYGTTREGGASTYGTVFKLDKNGVETVLYSFTGGADGCFPSGGLVTDAKGNFYGVTPECGASGVGTVFKVTKGGKETILHNFAGGTTDGAYPYYTSLLRDTKSNLYGVTFIGGTSNNGVLYRLNKRGTLTVLHSFAGGTTDGCFPYGTPTMDKVGNLFGTTQQCGASNSGTVYKVSKSGKETVRHNFAGGTTDGAYPLAGVISDTKGNLYGDTELGGASNLGTAYELKTKGTITLLHSFSTPDGTNPLGVLIRDAKGNLYGTTSKGGSGNAGTVWQITK